MLGVFLPPVQQLDWYGGYVFVRIVFDNKSERLTVFILKRHGRRDVFNTFMEFVVKNQLPLFKLISITTDGPPAMVRHVNGFIALCKQSESFPANHIVVLFIGIVWEDFKYERSDGYCNENSVLCSGQESEEKIIQGSLGGDRCRPHGSKMAQQR